MHYRSFMKIEALCLSSHCFTLCEIRYSVYILNTLSLFWNIASLSCNLIVLISYLNSYYILSELYIYTYSHEENNLILRDIQLNLAKFILS